MFYCAHSAETKVLLYIQNSAPTDVKHAWGRVGGDWFEPFHRLYTFNDPKYVGHRLGHNFLAFRWKTLNNEMNEMKWNNLFRVEKSKIDTKS